MKTSSFLSSISITSALCVLFAPALAHAAGHAEHGAEPGIGTFIINFVIFVSLMTYLLKDKLPAAWAARAAKIEEEVNRNERARQIAQAELDKAIKEKQKLPETVAEITASIEREQKEECARITNEGEELAKRAGKRLNDIVSQEIRAANANFEKKLTDAIIDVATSKLTSDWTSSKDEEFTRSHTLSAGTLATLTTGGRNG
jgi:F0F1-type ATP synthase membrane subunit b/b'